MRSGTNSDHRPFWLPASNYYVLSVAVSTAFFFLVWGTLHDGSDDTPWITAGLGASILLCGAVVLREVILRRARNQFHRQQRIMENRVTAAAVRAQINDPRYFSKLTLERNSAILNDIRQKSDAAKVLNKFSVGHREVFEICREYIALNEIELKTVNANSPRLAPLLKGRSSVAEYHRYHMLRWAEIESRALANDAQNLGKAVNKVEAAQNALSVIESALESYPAEDSLLQSQNVLRDLIVSIKVSDWIERAERSAFKGNYARAKSLYRDALFYLGRDNIHSDTRDRAAIRITDEIERIDSIIN